MSKEWPGQPLRPDRPATRGNTARLDTCAAGLGAQAQVAPAAHVLEVSNETVRVVVRVPGQQPHSRPAASCLFEGPRTSVEMLGIRNVPVGCVYYEIFWVTGVYLYDVVVYIYIYIH